MLQKNIGKKFSDKSNRKMRKGKKNIREFDDSPGFPNWRSIFSKKGRTGRRGLP